MLQTYCQLFLNTKSSHADETCLLIFIVNLDCYKWDKNLYFKTVIRVKSVEDNFSEYIIA